MDRLKQHVVVNAQNCWIWQGACDKGSPVIRLRNPRRLYPARRYSYETWNGVTVPHGSHVVTATCGHRQCVNPKHLSAVKRGVHSHRKWGLHPPEYCQRGHELSPWNTGKQRSGRFCIACDLTTRREWMRRRRTEHPDQEKAVRDDRLARKRALVESLKAACLRCDEMDKSCLDFHHRDPSEKDGTLSEAIRGWSFKRIREEIAKCDILCANCHRKLHWEQRNS